MFLLVSGFDAGFFWEQETVKTNNKKLGNNNRIQTYPLVIKRGNGKSFISGGFNGKRSMMIYVKMEVPLPRLITWGYTKITTKKSQTGMTDSSISLANTPKPWLASPSQRWDTKLCKTNPRIKLIIDEISFHMLCVTLYVLAFYVYVHPCPYGHLGKTCCTNEPATWPHVSLWRLNIID